ncbi:STK19 [Cordylochernes scorpioides]|uniref:STK19 n=1 Tax=Cordylochernes scorpioides TaxID=51811 RepID=A0ABY6LCV8_9ARAC|nr:STK19 [Cordylochernes scorpioides]
MCSSSNMEYKRCSSSNQGLEKEIDSALEQLKLMFPMEAFQYNMPPVVMRHQIYSFVPNRTLVDKHLNELREANTLRLFRMGEGEEEFAVISLPDLCDHIRRSASDTPTLRSELMQNGVLTRRTEPGSWWLSLPGAGKFVKALEAGRRASLSMIRRTQYKEMLESEFLARRLPRSALLGIKYHLHDLIGADLVSG